MHIYMYITTSPQWSDSSVCTHVRVEIDGHLVELSTLPVEIAIVISTGRDANHDLYQYKLVELQTLPVEIAIVISTSRECNCDLY